jgi:glutamate synthase (NADPH/NADH) small chain
MSPCCFDPVDGHDVNRFPGILNRKHPPQGGELQRRADANGPMPLNVQARQFNIQPLGVEVNANGKVSGVKMARTEMGQPDAKGRRRAEIVAGSEHVIPADAVVMAFGFRPHSMEWLAKHSVELDSQGRIIAPEGSDNAFQTSNPKIFAGGDIVRGSDLVVTAIAEGRKAAEGIMNFLEV